MHCNNMRFFNPQHFSRFGTRRLSHSLETAFSFYSSDCHLIGPIDPEVRMTKLQPAGGAP